MPSWNATRRVTGSYTRRSRLAATGAGWIHGSHRDLDVSEADLSLLGQSVAVDRYRELRARPARGMLGGLRPSAEQAAMLPRSTLETIGPAGGVVRRPLSGGGLEVAPLDRCWRYHFPTRAEWRTPRWPLPSPQSEEFWRSYGEPLTAIIDAARQLGWIMQVIKAQTPKYATQPSPRQRRRLTGALDYLAGFTANAWPRPYLDDQGEPQVRWAAPSLLGSFAMMVMLDLAGKGSVRTCERCGTPFVSSAPQAVYCSDRCRNAVQQARFRAKKKGAELGAGRRSPLAISRRATGHALRRRKTQKAS